jgi:hypothetical protein
VMTVPGSKKARSDSNAVSEMIIGLDALTEWSPRAGNIRPRRLKVSEAQTSHPDESSKYEQTFCREGDGLGLCIMVNRLW